MYFIVAITAGYSRAKAMQCSPHQLKKGWPAERAVNHPSLTNILETDQVLSASKCFKITFNHPKIISVPLNSKAVENTAMKHY
jgi:hypothetical protein